MFESLVEAFVAHPYLGVGVVFLFCGAGLPLPEEIVLIAAGYVVFNNDGPVGTMMAACALAILAGDMIPYLLGRYFGTRVLRLRYMRMWVTRRRLVKFDRWFRKRGDLVIFIARFLAGIRMVAFFTAGMMKMSWRRFLLLDGLGILVLVPPLVLVGKTGGEYIDGAIARVKQIETGILITTIVLLASIALWYWMRQRKRVRLALGEPADTYVEPTVEPAGEPAQTAPEDSDEEGSTPESKPS
jgi:membrane protein DedA with SNARE-associated domain